MAESRRSKNSSLKLDRAEDNMANGNIAGFSVAVFDQNGPIDSKTVAIGVDPHQQKRLSEQSIFRAASLSKPVFAYLVLKLIEDNQSNQAKQPPLGQFILPDNLKEKGFNLDTPLYETDPEFLKKFAVEDQDRAKNITARLILSHQTGLPIKPEMGFKFQFEPGTNYAYSNVGIQLLQDSIEKLTGGNLQTLAEENIFTPHHMNHSNFYRYHSVRVSKEEPKIEDIPDGTIIMQRVNDQLTAFWINERDGKLIKKSLPEDQVSNILKKLPELDSVAKDVNLIQMITEKYELGDLAKMQATCSLHTTAEDYARFVAGVFQNKKISDQIFHKEASLMNDPWAIHEELTQEDLKKIGWGIGFGLQVNGSAVTHAFHGGDMDYWRAFVVIDTGKQTGMVYLANSKNGMLLVDDLFSKNDFAVPDIFKYFFQKFGFARRFEPDWPDQELLRVVKIIYSNEKDLLKLQENEIKVKSDATCYQLSITCEPQHALFNRVIFKQYQDFIEMHPIKEARIVPAQDDKKTPILSLTITIPDNDRYKQFIDKLSMLGLLPCLNTPSVRAENTTSSIPPPTPFKKYY